MFAAKTIAEGRGVLANFTGPWEPMQSVADLPSDPQVVANGYLTAIAGEPLQVVSPPTQFDGSVPIPGPAPRLGQHTDEVLLALGLSEPEVAARRGRAIIG